MKKILMVLGLISLVGCSTYKTPEEEYLARNRKTCMNNMSKCETKTDTLSYLSEDGTEIKIPMQKIVVPKKQVAKSEPNIVDEDKEDVSFEGVNMDLKPEVKPNEATLENEFNAELEGL